MQNRSLTEQDYINAAELLGIETAIIKAVAEVESAGEGFLPNGLPKILFEGHLFHNFTEGKYDNIEPTISYPKWTKKHYLGGEEEYKRYHIARALDDLAAKESTSWGKFQILGKNYKECGYESVNDYVYDMQLTEAHHLKAFVNLIKSWGIDKALKSKNWRVFARRYNGPLYERNKYHIRMKQAYEKYRTG